MMMGFLAFVNFFTLRVSLSVAIVDMVNSTYRRQVDAASAASTATVNTSYSSSSDGGGRHQRPNSSHESRDGDDDDNSTSHVDDSGNVSTG